MHANAHSSAHKVNSARYVHVLELHAFMNNYTKLLKVPFLSHSFQKEVIISGDNYYFLHKNCMILFCIEVKITLQYNMKVLSILLLSIFTLVVCRSIINAQGTTHYYIHIHSLPIV